MKRTILLFTFAFITYTGFGQSVDKINDISIQPIDHATLALGWQDKTIVIDPSTDPKNLQNIAAPAFVLITDIHGDHFNVSSLENLDLGKATLIVPQAVADQLPQKYRKQMRILKNGENFTSSGIAIEAIPMYNLPEKADAFHTKGRGNGYVITLGNKRIYISGDTEDIPEMRTLSNIDIAFVCMNLPYTMTVQQAADAVLAFKPKVVYPYHYRGQNGKSDIKRFQELVNTKDKNIQVILRDWYPGE